MDLKRQLRKFLIITFAMVLVAVGIYFFWVPYNIAPGGMTGMAVIVQYFLKSLPISIILGIGNLILLIIGFIFLGKEFGGYTIYASILLTLYTRLFEILNPSNSPLVEDKLLCVIFGAVFVGLGIGLTFNEGASTGGTDIIAAIIAKFSHYSISNGVLISDTIITIIAVVVLGIEVGMYSLIAIIINTLVIDKVIQGANSKIAMTIITNYFDDVNSFINQDVNRGTTIYTAEGGFSFQDRKIIYTVLSSREYVRVKNYLKAKDPSAFVTSSNVSEVLGEGFSYDIQNY